MHFVAYLLPSLLLLLHLPYPSTAQFDLSNLLAADMFGLGDDMMQRLPLTQLMAFVTDFENTMDKLLESVQHRTCANHIKETVRGMKELKYWAIKMLDASTKLPSGMIMGQLQYIGNFDECVNLQNISIMDSTFNGQYCLAQLCSSTNSVCDSKTLTVGKQLFDLGQLLDESGSDVIVLDILPDILQYTESITIRTAICVPSTCSSRDTEIFMNVVTEYFDLPVTINVKESECYVLKGVLNEAIDYFAIVLLVFFVGLAVCSTVYDVQTRDTGKRKPLLVAFSVYTNGKRLFNRSTNRDTLHALHGVRFLSMVWIVLGHQFVIDFLRPLTNAKYAYELIKSGINHIVLCAVFAVDTFLVLSGLLLSYVFLNHMRKKTHFNLPFFYLHRYIRLTPLLAVMVLLDVSILRNLGSGPLWGLHKQPGCPSSWWQVLLYIKNYIKPLDCMIHTWYLSVDMQLFWLSPLLLIPLWKRPKLGRLLLIGSIFLSWLIAFSIAYIGKLAHPLTITVSDEVRTQSSDEFYMSTHARCGPWLLGIALGYILHCIRNNNQPIILSKMASMFIWTIVFVLMIQTLWSVRPLLEHDYVYDRFNASLFLSTQNMIWSLSVCLLIFMCVTGNGGIINELLSQGFWQPLSRLTYSIYMLHTVLQLYAMASTRTPHYYTYLTEMTSFLGNMLITIVMAIPFCLLFESPFIIMEKILFLKESEIPVKKTKDVNHDYIIIENEKNIVNHLKEEKEYI